VDLVEKVTAALERSVLPAVIARGGVVRVLAVRNGVATLEVSGSPGASVPLISRIEVLIRAAVPEVTRVQLVGPGGGKSPQMKARGSLTERVCRVLDAEINPTIAAHRGRVVLVEVEEGWVRIRLEGGCQGCSLAEVTVRQGIEPVLRSRVPEMVGLVDITDHEAGSDPYYSAAKR
jgi:Fe-S cluster biogenesis protein NfuA